MMMMTGLLLFIDNVITSARADVDCPGISQTLDTDPRCVPSATSKSCPGSDRGPFFDTRYTRTDGVQVRYFTLYREYGYYFDDDLNFNPSGANSAVDGCGCKSNYQTTSFLMAPTWYSNERPWGDLRVEYQDDGTEFKYIQIVTDKNTQYTTVCSFCISPSYAIATTGANIGKSVNGPPNDKMLCAPTPKGAEQEWGCLNDGACTRLDKATCKRDPHDLCQCQKECCQEYTGTCMVGTCNRLNDAACHCLTHVHHNSPAKPICDTCDPGWGPPVNTVDTEWNHSHSPCSRAQCDRGCGNPSPLDDEALADMKTGLFATYADAVANTVTGLNQASKFGVCTSSNQCKCTQNHRLGVNGDSPPPLYMFDATDQNYRPFNKTAPCSRKEINPDQTGAECELGWRSTFVDVGKEEQDIRSNGDCAIPDCHATIFRRSKSEQRNNDTGCNGEFGTCKHDVASGTNYCVCKYPTMDPANNCLTCVTGADKRPMWQGVKCDQPICRNAVNQDTCEKGVCKGDPAVDTSPWCDCDRSKFYGDRCQFKICDAVCNGVCDTDTGSCGFDAEHTVMNATDGKPMFCKDGWDSVRVPVSSLPTYFIYGDWVTTLPVQKRAVNPVDGSTIYMVEDLQFTKMVDSLGHGRYYVGTIADFDVDKWSQYDMVADGKYLLRQCPAGSVAMC